MIVVSFGCLGFVSTVGFSLVVFLISGLVSVLLTARWLGALVTRR